VPACVGEIKQKVEMNISVRALRGRERAKRRDEYILRACVRAWERERAKGGDEYICACVHGREREQKEEMNISVCVCAWERERAKSGDEYICVCVRACVLACVRGIGRESKKCCKLL